jgi:murein tripeptide amidase MpaA
VDVWRVAGTGIDAYMTPENMEDGTSTLSSNYTILPIPVPTALSEKHQNSMVERPIPDSYITKKKKAYFNLTYLSHDFHSQYHSTANITHFMKSLVHTFPNHTSLIHIGHSAEGRKLMGIKIVNPEPVPAGGKQRKGFVILGAQHAREWVATSTALYLAHALSVDPTEQGDHTRRALRRLLDHFEFHIIPLPNPDGHRYTRRHNRLWYKNRQIVSTGEDHTVCKGIDMNRNWVRNPRLPPARR